jgi:RimJ/RimL family protein N-acetyltransferase
VAHELVVRRAEPGDEPVLRQLRLQAIADAPEQFGETLSQLQLRSDEQWRELLATVLPPNSQAAFIAEVDGTPVATVYGLHDPSDRATARLGGMWVAPASRRQGIASALAQELRAWAVQLGKMRIRLWVADDSIAAKRLYERLGFRPTGNERTFPGIPGRRLLEMELLVTDPQGNAACG